MAAKKSDYAIDSKMKTRTTDARDGHNMRSTPENRKQDRGSSANYVTVLEILNVMLRSVSNSLPQIREAAPTLPTLTAVSDARDELIRCAVSR